MGGKKGRGMNHIPKQTIKTQPQHAFLCLVFAWSKMPQAEHNSFSSSPSPSPPLFCGIVVFTNFLPLSVLCCIAYDINKTSILRTLTFCFRTHKEARVPSLTQYFLKMALKCNVFLKNLFRSSVDCRVNDLSYIGSNSWRQVHMLS